MLSFMVQQDTQRHEQHDVQNKMHRPELIGAVLKHFERAFVDRRHGSKVERCQRSQDDKHRPKDQQTYADGHSQERLNWLRIAEIKGLLARPQGDRSTRLGRHSQCDGGSTPTSCSTDLAMSALRALSSARMTSRGNSDPGTPWPASPPATCRSFRPESPLAGERGQVP